MIRRIFVCAALSASLLMTSCLKNDRTTVVRKVKYADGIEFANGTTLTFGYDKEGRVTTIACNDAPTGKDSTYHIEYDIIRPYSQSTVTIQCNDREWLMKFNGLGLVDSYYELSEGLYTGLSSFGYYDNNYHLTQITDIAGHGSSVIYWAYNVPYDQTLTYNSGESSVTKNMRYSYAEGVTNMQTNIDLLPLLVPEHLEGSHLNPCVACAVTVYGTRSYALPSAVMITSTGVPDTDDGDDESGAEDDDNENPSLRTETRLFNFTTDADGFVNAVSTIETEGEEPELLFRVNYFTSTTVE